MGASLFNRYVWLIDTIYSADKITKSDIDKAWAKCSLNTEHETKYEVRSFHRHKETIEEMFGIQIDCDKTAGNVYFIKNKGTLKHGSFLFSLINDFALVNMMADNENLRERIIFEDLPRGGRFLNTMAEAMRDGKIVDMKYRYEDGTRIQTVLMPYAVKQYDRGWYVIGKKSNSPEDKLAIYALENILSLEITDKNYKYPRSWKAQRYFDGFFGVDKSAEPETITLRVTGSYIDTLRRHPLHSSQHELETGADYSVFGYFLAPTEDVARLIRAMGASVEVLSPGSLRQQFLDETQAQARLYGMNLHYVGEQLSLF